MGIKYLHTLVIGSGAAGLAAAVRLEALSVSPIAIYTEGLEYGTSLNTGSDKQTYYKLGMYGAEPDSPGQMAADLMAGGAMHGDIALVEAALSQQTFAHLVNLGVPFPHDEFGEFIGYKTDHDPRRRATSCGPYTSREMCLALINEVKKRRIEVQEGKVAIQLLVSADRCLGAIFLDSRSGSREAVLADNVIFAVGGPGSLYESSVYPALQTGGIGLALAAGAQAVNLAESQYGLAATRFRWNVSGSYMQALPRFISVDGNGVEREFLRPYFASVPQMYDAVFLKGYQWPFAASHVSGSSLIDIFVYIETVERKRKVYLDFRSDPEDLQLENLSPETREYLRRSNASQPQPLERLKSINAPALELFRRHGIDLAAEPLEIAVCAQHCNGGLAGDIWWESVNLKHFFPIGEVNGSHGVTRPGGSALNAGQVGAFRAAERIARRPAAPIDRDTAEVIAAEALQQYSAQFEKTAVLSWQTERQKIQHRMSESGAFIRTREQAVRALEETRRQFLDLSQDGLGGLSSRDCLEALRNRHLCLAALYYLQAIMGQIERIGSRGGSIVLSDGGQLIHPRLDGKWRMLPEVPGYRRQMMTIVRGQDGLPVVGFAPCRELPRPDGWFEVIWKEDRENQYHE